MRHQPEGSTSVFRRLLFAAVAASALWGGWSVGAQTPAPAPTEPAAANRRIEGDWVRLDTEGAGSFGGLNASIPPAQLLPGVTAGRGAGARGNAGAAGRAGGARGAAPAGARGPNPEGVPYIVVAQPCGGGGGARGNGALLINPDSGGIHIIEHKDEVVFAGERGGVRHIYLDRRLHPNNWVPSGAGHSIGHYEGEALVVETVGFTPGNVVAGGARTPETRLIERFEVAPDGKRLTITYTWDDPKIYAKPHTYKYVFERVPAVSYAFEDWCDAGDPVEQQSIVPPKQL
jgi:hypothetical protein